MKRITTGIIALTMLMLPSCGTDNTDQPLTETTTEPIVISANAKYKMSDLEDGAYYLGEDTLAVFPYGDRFYKAGAELGYFDLTTDMAYTKLCDLGDIKEADVYVDDRGIYCFNGSDVLVFSHDGTTSKEYKVSDADTRSYQIQITSVEDYILVSGSRNTESGIFQTYIYTVERSTGKIQEYVISESPLLDTLLSFEPGSKKNTAIMVKSAITDEIMMMGGESAHNVSVFDASKGKLNNEYTYNFSISGADYVAEDDCFYGMFPNTYLTSAGAFRLASAKFGETEFTGYRNVTGAAAFAPIKTAVEASSEKLHAMGLDYHPHHFFTGYDYICLDEHNDTVCIFSGNPNETGETLTVLYPTQVLSLMFSGTQLGNNLDSAVFRPNIEFEEANDVTVKSKTYPLEEFSDRLRMKLLAGDNDYDIVYLDNAGEILAHLLRYELYLPLEGYSEIASSYDNYIAGVKDVMSYNGHIYGVPYNIGGLSLSVQEDYHELGLSPLEGAYSFDDFWRICEEVKNNPDGDVITMDFQLFRQLMKSVIEDGAEKGAMDDKAVQDTIAKFMEYRNAGIITPWNNMSNFLFIHINTFSQTGLKMGNYNSDFRELIPYPSYNGKTYVPVESMIYANSLTKNADLSVKYLSMLMTKEFAAEAVSTKSNLWKEKSDYFVFGSYGTDTEALIESGYEMPVKPYEYGEYDSYLMDHGSTALINAAPNLYSEGLDELICSVFNELAAGNLSAEEAAEMICKEARYRILE